MEQILPGWAFFGRCRRSPSGTPGDIIPQLVTVPREAFIIGLVVSPMGGLVKRIGFNGKKYLQRVRN